MIKVTLISDLRKQWEYSKQTHSLEYAYGRNMIAVYRKEGKNGDKLELLISLENVFVETTPEITQ